MGVQRKVTGLQNLVTQVEEAKSALRLLEQQVRNLPFNPADPNEVERTIREAHAMVDEQMAGYGSNAIVMTLVQDFKRSIRSLIQR